MKVCQTAASAIPTISYLSATRTWLAAWSLAAVPLATALPAQVDPASPTYNIAVDGDNITMTVHENEGMAMKDFIKIAENVTGKVFIYKSEEVEQEVNKITFIGTVRL